LWTTSRVHGSSLYEWWSPHVHRVASSSRSINWGPKHHGNGPAGWPGPTGTGLSRPDLVAPSLPWVLLTFCTLPPFNCIILVTSSLLPR
jgi:hypothetical protein